jgi:hypothetical protein
MYAMLTTLYPEYDFLPWKFKIKSSSMADDRAVRSKTLDYVEKELNIAKPEDWYRISKQQLDELGALRILFNNRRSLYDNLMEFRPGWFWDEDELTLLPPDQRPRKRKSVLAPILEAPDDAFNPSLEKIDELMQRVLRDDESSQKY